MVLYKKIIWGRFMSLSQTEIQQTLAMLEETPKHIQTLIGTASANILTAKTNEDTWSVNEILAHLRACADVWGQGIQRMLNEDNPTIRYVSPRTYVKKTRYEALAFEGSFRAFREQRIMLLGLLKALPPESWLKQGIFTGTTRGKHQTVYSYARRIADHEHHHFTQIKRVIQEVTRNQV